MTLFGSRKIKHSLHNLLCISLLHLCSYATHAQSTMPAEANVSKGTCGNSTPDNRLFTSVQGTVTKVIDGRTIVLALPGSSLVQVHLAGIALEHRSSTKAAEHLRDTLLNKEVNVSVSSNDWIVLDQHPEKITGVVRSSEAPSNDAGFVLISRGLARFEFPKPQTMSSYSECQYQKAEREARSQKIGMWQ